jgi:hypothetical protein
LFRRYSLDATTFNAIVAKMRGVFPRVQFRPIAASTQWRKSSP